MKSSFQRLIQLEESIGLLSNCKTDPVECSDHPELNEDLQRLLEINLEREVILSKFQQEAPDKPNV